MKNFQESRGIYENYKSVVDSKIVIEEASPNWGRLMNKLNPAFTQGGKAEKSATEERYRFLQEIETAILYGLKEANMDLNEEHAPAFIKDYLIQHYPTLDKSLIEAIKTELEKTPSSVTSGVNRPAIGSKGGKRDLRKAIDAAHKMVVLKPYTANYIPPVSPLSHPSKQASTKSAPSTPAAAATPAPSPSPTPAPAASAATPNPAAAPTTPSKVAPTTPKAGVKLRKTPSKSSKVASATKAVPSFNKFAKSAGKKISSVKKKLKKPSVNSKKP